MFCSHAAQHPIQRLVPGGATSGVPPRGHRRGLHAAPGTRPLAPGAEEGVLLAALQHQGHMFAQGRLATSHYDPPTVGSGEGRHLDSLKFSVTVGIGIWIFLVYVIFTKAFHRWLSKLDIQSRPSYPPPQSG